MFNEMIKLLVERKEFFLELLIQHIEISLIAIVFAIIFGGLIGILISEYNKFSKVIINVINFLYTIPSISLLGFLIPFSGIGNTTAIIALIIYALLPMVRNTYTGITNVNEKLVEAAEGMGSTKFQVLVKVKIPLAMPIIMSGIRSMVTMTIALAGIASFIGAGGLGVAIYRGITTNNIAMTMDGSILIALLALSVDFILSLFERKSNLRSKKLIIPLVLVLLTFLVGNKLYVSDETKTINIATKPMTEQHILGEVLKQLIESESDINVKLTQGVGGGTSNIFPAMKKGDFDIYPEYTGTGWNMVLKNDGLYTEDMFNKLEKSYSDEYNMEWVGMYGFNNTYGLALRSEIANEYNIKTYSDLAKVGDNLIFGAEYDFFEREDGYDTLTQFYNFNFSKTVDMDIGLKYQAINENSIDVMNVFTTDAQLNNKNIVVLEDDLNFYPSYKCGNVVRIETLEKYPELVKILNSLDDIIDDETMSKLNYEVEVNHRQAKDVATEFLKNAKILN